MSLWSFYPPLDNLGPLVLGSTNKYSNKLLVKALYLCTEMYNNERFSTAF